MRKAYKYRLYPRKDEIERLDNSLYLCRRLYNAALEQRIIAYRSFGSSVNYNDQSLQLPMLKAGMGEYKAAYAQTLQDTLRRLDKSYKNFFRRVKNGEKPGFPRFKSRNRFKSITYPQSGFEVLPNGHLKLSKIGTIRMFMHRPIEGEIKTLTIKRDDAGDWYAIFSVELPDVEKRLPETAIGVDVGLENLAALSTGEIIEPPKCLVRSKDGIKRKQREVSRKKKGSNNRRKAVKKLAKAHRRVQRQRDDHLHKVSRNLIGRADAIVFENLNIHGMMKNHHLAKAISDASWGKLMQYTAFKAEEAGRHVVFIDPRGTSQTCSRCGATVRKSLKDRFHVCPHCGLFLDRDHNAALNILRIGRGAPELTPVETGPLPARASPIDEAGSPHL